MLTEVKQLSLSLLALLLVLPSSPHSAPLVGEYLSKALGCRGCHLVAGNGGRLGPPLVDLGKRLSPEQLRQTLSVRREGSVMPTYAHLTKPELDALLNYLLTL